MNATRREGLPEGGSVMPLGSGQGLWCDASRGGGATTGRSYVDVSATRRGAMPGDGHPEGRCGRTVLSENSLGSSPEENNLVAKPRAIYLNHPLPGPLR